jgi:hypothetical protein
MVPG